MSPRLSAAFPALPSRRSAMAERTSVNVRSGPRTFAPRGPVAGRKRRTAAARTTTNVNEHLLRLYVSGTSGQAAKAVERLQRICAEELQGRYRVEVIDVLRDPDRAERDRILATPTIVKAAPAPERRVVGDLSDTRTLLSGLDLLPSPGPR
jgi:circadian clock protein KaiB